MLDGCEFRKLCKLAKISIANEEFSDFFGKLHGIFDWVQQLQSIDTSKVEIETGAPCPSRKDVCSEVNKQAGVLSNTKFSKYGMFSVPKVIENE